MDPSAATRRPGDRRPITRVGLVVHSGREKATDTAATTADLFRQTGVEVMGSTEDEWHHPGVVLCEPEELAAACDLVVVLGGDGTFLRAAHLCRDRGVPLVGVNLGRLGFLSELEEVELAGAVPRLAAGDFDVEERMALTVEVRDLGGSVLGTSWALNEASVERTIPQRLISLEVRIGETTLARIPADALVLATPTGSTAYAFSAGGPILSPLVNAILLTPVAAHTLFNRTIVIDPAESLSVRPVDTSNTCVVSLDGRETIEVPVAGEVRVSRGDVPVRMVRLASFDFYARVREKFRLSL